MKSVAHPIGRAKGPGSAPHTFTFIAPDKEQLLRLGEFVTYEAAVDGRKRTIFSRIVSRQPLRLLPDDFSSDPAVNPEEIAALVGYTEGGQELFELTATLIGYYDELLGDFINPRLPPKAGWAIFLADNDTLARVLTKKRFGEVGAAHIGYLLSRSNNQVPIVIDAAAITSTHLAILASTGAGKSYLAAVLVEEFMMPYNRAAVLIIDPHGEYDTLSEMSQHPLFAMGSYQPQVQVLKPGDVKIRPAALTISDLKYLLPDLSERMEYLLGRAFYEMRRSSKRARGTADKWTRQELIAHLEQLKAGKGQAKEDSESLKGYASTADALIWRLESVLGRSVIFDDAQNMSLQALFRPGQCSVLQLNEIGEKEQQVLVGAILRRLLQARIQTDKEQVRKGHELYLPYPVFVLIEEAHKFAPHTADAISGPILKEILSEGRKFGVGIGVVSQRPGKLDADVLSQCNSHALLRIVNSLDQQRVQESIETVGRDLLQELPALTKGQAIIAGHTTNTPIICRVRPRLTPHGADTKDAPSLWVNFPSGDSNR